MTPEELEKLPKPLERTMTVLELSIMSEIVERIKEAAQITPVIDWLLVRLTAIGESKTRLKRLIGEAVKRLICKLMISMSRRRGQDLYETKRSTRRLEKIMSAMRIINGCNRQ